MWHVLFFCFLVKQLYFVVGEIMLCQRVTCNSPIAFIELDGPLVYRLYILRFLSEGDLIPVSVYVAPSSRGSEWW